MKVILMKEIKPCPFCGGKMSVTYNSLGTFNFWHIEPTVCLCSEPFQISTDNAKTINEAIEIWNTRRYIDYET